MKPKIYLDNCCYNRPYDDQSQIRINLESQAKLFIQKLISFETLELVTSVMSYYENSRNPDKKHREAISAFMKKHETMCVTENDTIWNIQGTIVSTGIKEADAFHLASAIFANCDCFITTDDRILKYRTESIRIINPIQLIIEMR